MSFYFESNQGIEITDEEEFRTKFCGQCIYKDVCENWEFATAQTLYSNKTKGSNPRPFIGGKTGKKGVYRCASFESTEHIEALT